MEALELMGKESCKRNEEAIGNVVVKDNDEVEYKKMQRNNKKQTKWKEEDYLHDEIRKKTVEESKWEDNLDKLGEQAEKDP